MPTDLLILNLGAVAIIVGAAWRLSRDITTLQVQVMTLTVRIGSLESRILSLRSPE